MSVNSRGLSESIKRRAVFDYHRQNGDFLIIQETHSTPNDEKVWESEWGGKVIFSHGTSAARGIAVFTSKKLYSQIKNIYTDTEGRTVIFDIEDQGVVITIVAIYAPNQDSPGYFNGITQLLRQRQENKVIIGDFNLVLDVELDRYNTYNNNNKAKNVIQDMMDEFYLKDVWRLQNQEKCEYSWRKGLGSNMKASRIDYALVSGGLDQKVQVPQYLASIKTDHRAFYMVIDTMESERGTGYWKLNVKTLYDVEYIQAINREIENCLASTVSKNPIDRWEILKSRIKKASINYTRNKSSEDKLIIGQLSEIINDYECKLPLNQQDDMILEKTKEDFEEKMFERTKGIMFRSKVKWYEQGEKNTKYFYALEKTKYNAKTCYKVITDRGAEITSAHEILEEQRKFYEELYKKDDDVAFTVENSFNLYVPTDIQRKQDSQLTLDDLYFAAKRMNNGKTPGDDGIPVDFYKVFWGKLKNSFYEMVMEAYKQKLLHPTARHGILNLIPKPGKDSRYIKNLRPITLLNVDYKIIEKAIADKMMPALEHIINKDQRGFMKDRRISVNIRKMLDILHLANQEDLEAVVLSLDFVKCFDK